MKQAAVDNFISTMDTSLSVIDNLLNLELDAKIYEWDDETIVAITRKILRAYIKNDG